MKKILWCGGSHLIHSKNAIKHIFKESDNNFFPTAGPTNRHWFDKGGRYHVNGDVVSDPRDERYSFHINQYSSVIFMGQFINIRFFRAGSKLVSRALYDSLYPYKYAYLKGGLINHPLELFFNEFVPK